MLERRCRRCALPTAAMWRTLLLAGTLSLASSQQVKTVQDLRNEIYTQLPLGPGKAGDACVRLLTATGEVGCAAPTQLPTEGRLVRITQLDGSLQYPADAVFVMPPALLADFLALCHTQPSFAAAVRGVLVEPGPAPDYSTAAEAPLQQYALYANKSYAWNPKGVGLNDLSFPFPIFLLDADTAANAQKRAQYNAEQDMSGALNHAKMRLVMEASGNSSACIAAKTCLPVGGHSVLAALPPLPPLASANASAGGGDDMQAIWILAQWDTTSMFHAAMVGAESPVSGLIAMLAAAELLGSAGASSAVARYRRRLVFAALGGEPWGMMGSKRLLWEAASGSPALAGFNVSKEAVAAVLEVGPVGRGIPDPAAPAAHHSDGMLHLFTHTPGGGEAAATDVIGALQAAVGDLRQALGKEIRVSPAQATPGLPPTASAGSFVRVLDGERFWDAAPPAAAGNASSALPAVLLSDFEAAFARPPTFQSHYDTAATVDADSIATAAVLVARAAHALALGGAAGAELALPVNYTAVKDTVQGLIQCLLNSTEGLNCSLAQLMMSPVNQGHLSHYIGILRTLTADPQTPDPVVKTDFERFLWNWLAFATRPKPANSSGNGSSGAGGAGTGGDEDLQRCQPLNATACPPGFVCAGSRSIKGPEGQGFCLNATVRYVPSYSTSLLCDGCDGANTNYEFRWKASDAAAQWEQQYRWPTDPMYCESNWPNDTPALTLYLKEDQAVEYVLLGAGLVVAGASVAGTLLVRLAYHRKLKRQ